MRKFFSEYALTILSAVITAVLIIICSPIGEETRISILKAVGFYEDKFEMVEVTFDAGGGKFDTITYQNTHLDETNIYIAEDTIIIEIKKGETLSEEDIPKPTKEGFVLTDSTKYFYDEKGNVLDTTTVISEKVTYTAKYKSTNEGDTFTGTGIKNNYLFINNESIGEFKVGTTFNWHNYTWKVLKIESNQALIITENVLDSSFNTDTYEEGIEYSNSTQTCGNQTVNNCYKGSILEDKMEEFYTNKLGSDEIVVNTRDVSLGIHSSEYTYSTGAYNPYVFALSYEEAQRYLNSNQKRVAYNGSSAMAYWLRSGKRYSEVVCKNGKDDNGNCIDNNKETVYDNTQSCFINYDGSLSATKYNTKLGIRPALWIDLSKVGKDDIELIN